MILSRYTQAIKDNEGGIHLFNYLNKKWITLDHSLYDKLLIYQNDIKSFEAIHPDLYSILISENFLVEDQNNDIYKAHQQITKELASCDHVSITINPTLDCNLRCWYCYENRHVGSVMSEEMIHNTISFVNTFLENNKIKVLNLSFFGGEPLLHYKKVIHPILTEIHKICRESKTLLQIHFTTNGILISDRVLNELKGISDSVSFQIAFDGGSVIHNSVKNFGTNSDCYSLSVQNVIKAIEAGHVVTVRCNYRRQTLNSFMELIEELKPYHKSPRLRFLFQKIWQEPDNQELRKTKSLFFEDIKRRFKINSNLNDLSGHSLNRCYADYKHNFVINYDGRVFKCTARDFTDNYSIGRISKNGLELIGMQNTTDFPYPDFCRECKILPICPTCSQSRLEKKDIGCPIDLDQAAILRNIKATFTDLTGIPVSI